MSKPDHSPVVEDGIVVGNTYDKYGSKNPVVRWMVNNFCRSVDQLISRTRPATILEAGCGEGHITERLLDQTEATIHALDISEYVLDQARNLIGRRADADRVRFENLNVFNVDPEQLRADLVVCCEVLEHLDDPAEGLRILAQAASPYAILSVPREPLWRMMNLARFAYISDLGNTPGHLQHWSRNSFQRFVSTEFDIVETLTPLPWTFILAKSRSA